MQIRSITISEILNSVASQAFRHLVEGLRIQVSVSLGLTGAFSSPPDAIWAFGSNHLYVTGENATAGIFATYPSQHLNVVNGFFDQVRRCLERART